MSIMNVSHLTKKFGDFIAVDDISFDLKEGEILGLLGPNGAGKTTTLNILLGLIIPTAGTIEYFGNNFFHHKSRCLQEINFTSAFNKLQNRITVWENLLVFGELYQVDGLKKRIDELVEYFEIQDILHKIFFDLSSGQKTRVNIVKSLLNNPKILLMDEPTASLDPDISDKLLSLIERFKKEKHISILYTSHDMHEVTRVCDEVIFLDHGKIVAKDTPLGLTKRVQSAQLRLTFDTHKDQIESYLINDKYIFQFDNDHVVVITTHEADIPKLIFDLKKLGVWITDIEVKKPTLEHVFLQIVRGDSYVFEKN